MADLREKVYGMFILGTSGGGYKAALKRGLGGIIFFTHDIISTEQIKSLIEDCKKSAKNQPFLSIDQEGGRVERTENIHGGKKYLSAKYAFQQGILEKQTENIAKELKSYGFNLNFAPCIDVNTNPDNPIIGERAFSDNAEDVINAEKIVSAVYKENGIIPCIKHYPGHGDANADSHLTLPVIELSLKEMENTHIKPFKSAIANGADMVMAAHLNCKCFDNDFTPASLSKNALDYLREKLNFNGVIISDDMVMKGISENHTPFDACIKGINAGLNMFIYRNSDEGIINTIEMIVDAANKDELLRERIDISYAKISELKRKISKNV